jgi:hypothetical protein
MEFLSRVSEFVTEAGNQVSQKAKDVAGLTKLNMDIRMKEDFIRRQYTEIGKQYVDLYENEANPSTEGEQVLFDEMAKIKEARADIDRLKEELDGIKNIKKCGDCNAAVSKEAKFCPQCGKEFEDVEESVFEDEDDFFGSDAVDKAKDVAADVADKAKDLASDVADKAEEVKDAVQEKVEDIAGN